MDVRAAASRRAASRRAAPEGAAPEGAAPEGARPEGPRPERAAPEGGEPADLLDRLRAIDQRTRGGPSADGRDLRELAERGRSRALVVLLARLVAVALPWPVNGVTATVSVLVMASWPYALAGTAGAAVETNALRGGAGHLFALATTLTCVVMLAASWLAWRSAGPLAASVSPLLNASPGRDGFTGWLAGRLRAPGQLLAGTGGAGLAALLMYALSHQPAGALSVSAWLYLVAVWTGFVGGGVVYWLATVAEIPLRLRRCGDLQMAWIDPAHTPAVVALCRVYARVAGGLALGVLITELSTMTVTSDDPGPLMRCFFVGFPVFAALMALYVGVQPYVTLWHLVGRYIDRVVDPLMAQTTHPPHDLLLHADLGSAFSAYGRIRGLRRLPVRTATLLQYVTGIVASLIVYFLQQLLA